MCLPPSYDLRKIKKAMRLILLCKERGEKYTGDAEPRKEWAHCLIPTDSYQAQLIADLIEWEFGFANATFFVNMYREDTNEIHVGVSTVYEVVKRLKPKINMIANEGKDRSTLIVHGVERTFAGHCNF